MAQPPLPHYTCSSDDNARPWARRDGDFDSRYMTFVINSPKHLGLEKAPDAAAQAGRGHFSLEPVVSLLPCAGIKWSFGARRFLRRRMCAASPSKPPSVPLALYTPPNSDTNTVSFHTCSSSLRPAATLHQSAAVLIASSPTGLPHSSCPRTISLLDGRLMIR